MATVLKEAVLTTASELLDLSYEKLDLKDGRVVPRIETGISGATVTLAEVAPARLSAGAPLQFEGMFHPIQVRDTLSGRPNDYLTHVTATHVAEVEVDTREGDVRVLRVIAAHDVGRDSQA